MVGPTTGAPAMRPRQRRRREGRLGAALLTLVAIGATVASCGDDGPGTARAGVDHRVAVVEEALAPPGTELAADVQVQPGSSLVGSVFPEVGFSSESTEPTVVGWHATLVVDGNPVEVWNSYAEALDIDGADAVNACAVSALAPMTVGSSESGEPPPRRFLTEDRLDGENRITCSYVSAAMEMSMSVGAACQHNEDARCSLVPVSHLRIAVIDQPALDTDIVFLGTDQLRHERAIQQACEPATDCPVGALPEGPPVADIPDGPVVAPALDVSGESVLPQPGERFDAQLDYFLDYRDDSAVHVPEGGRTLVAPALLIDCNSGLVAVLEVPGSPTAAVETFRADVDQSAMGPAASGTTSEGTDWAYGSVSETGGEDIRYVALADDDATSLVSVRECGD